MVLAGSGTPEKRFGGPTLLKGPTQEPMFQLLRSLLHWNHEGFEGTQHPSGYGSKANHRGNAEFSPCFHLPWVHFWAPIFDPHPYGCGFPFILQGDRHVATDTSLRYSAFERWDVLYVWALLVVSLLLWALRVISELARPALGPTLLWHQENNLPSHKCHVSGGRKGMNLF